ncbi:E1 [Serinus canaria papillomavirus 1]|uniref:E1 n=1 Tax=Serinus canaria papillomavirus 1 TaxID=2094713 RepID=UPI000D0C0FB8|nr:E1 [Serinus canaria papillomavirus 1]AVH76290.1 E1 [Serinus canaria papillomavirus 1]
MDFIEQEADCSSPLQSLEEAEEEWDRVSQLFDSGPEDGTYDSPDRALHRGLLNEQQREDSEVLLQELAGGLCGKRARPPTPRRNVPAQLQGMQSSPSLQALSLSPSHLPKKACRVLRFELPEAGFGVSEKENKRLPRRQLDRAQSGSPKSPNPRDASGMSGESPLQQAGGVHAPRRPLRVLQIAGHNSQSTEDSLLSNSEGYESMQTSSGSQAPPAGENSWEKLLQRCLTAKNRRATAMAIFKDTYNASYTEITREFKSDKTQSYEWVLFILGISDELMLSLTNCLKAVTDFIIYDLIYSKYSGLLYLGFRSSKNREGLRRCLKNYNVSNEKIVLCDPPNKRSVLSALFFQKLFQCHGEPPSWCSDVLSNEQLSGEGFELSKMIQWALDNKHHDESSIAYHYSVYAERDLNAQLWLQSNSQAKYVRDAAQMVRHYLRGRLHATPMEEFLASRIREYDDDDDEDGWKRIVVFLRYQHIQFKEFLRTFRYWLQGRPKKSTIAICGIPDSGKSMFAMSLCKFLDGRVLSFNNHASHFWLQPLTECKFAVIDDVTIPCWEYINIYLRNALDGNPISIDCKHRAPVQLKCPPILITSNYDPLIHGNDGSGKGFPYLKSRIQFLLFNRTIPILGQTPRFLIQEKDWRSFFLKFKEDLQLKIDEYDYGQPIPEACRSPDTGGRHT